MIFAGGPGVLAAVERSLAEPLAVPLDQQPDSPEFFIDDWLFVKQIVLAKRGYVASQHVHNYDHVTMLAVGSVDIWIDGAYAGLREGPTPIEIKAGQKHTFQAATDGCVLFCVHNLRGEGYPAIREETAPKE